MRSIEVIQTGCYSKYARCILQSILLSMTANGTLAIMHQKKSGHRFFEWLRVNVSNGWTFADIPFIRAADGQVIGIQELRLHMISQSMLLSQLKSALSHLLGVLPEEGPKFILYSGISKDVDYDEMFRTRLYFPESQYDFRNPKEQLMTKEDVYAVYDEIRGIKSFKNNDPFFIHGRESFFKEFIGLMKSFFEFLSKFCTDRSFGVLAESFFDVSMSDFQVLMLASLLFQKDMSYKKFISELDARSSLSKKDRKTAKVIMDAWVESAVYKKGLDLFEFAEKDKELDLPIREHLFAMTLTHYEGVL